MEILIKRHGDCESLIFGLLKINVHFRSNKTLYNLTFRKFKNQIGIPNFTLFFIFI